MTLDSAQSQTAEAKKLHPTATPAGSDAGHEHAAHGKPETAVGGGWAAATLKEAHSLFNSAEHKLAGLIEGHTLNIPPLHDGTQQPGKASAAGDHTAATRTGDHTAAAKAGDQPTAAKTGEQATTARPGDHPIAGKPGEQGAAAKPGDHAPVPHAADAPPIKVAAAVDAGTPPRAADATTPARAAELTTPTRAADSPASTAVPTTPEAGPKGDAPKPVEAAAATGATPPKPTDGAPSAADAKAPFSFGHAFNSMVHAAEELNPMKVVAKAEEIVGHAWNATTNAATDLLENKDLTQSIVHSTTDKDGKVVNTIDQAKANQLLDMQSMQNVFTGKDGEIHRAAVSAMFDKLGKASTDGAETPLYKEMDAQRKQAIADGHKPGEQWTDKNGMYSLDKNGNLLSVTGEGAQRDVRWVGPNGSSYEKDAKGKETWTKDGRELQQVGKDDFKLTDEHGNHTEYDGKGATGKTIMQVAEGTITEFNSNRAAIDEKSARLLPDDFITNPNANGYSHRDGQGHQLIKDSLRHGESIFTEHEGTFRIHDGKMYHEDKPGQETEVKELPKWITRGPDGQFHYAGMNIDQHDVLTGTSNNMRMADMSNTTTAGKDPAHPLTITAGDGKQVVQKKGEFTETHVTDPKTGTTLAERVDGAGKPVALYNFKTGTMHGDGITFTEQGSHIDGTNFAVSSRGAVESASSWEGANRSAGISDYSGSLSDNFAGDASSFSSSDSSGSSDGSSDTSSDTASDSQQQQQPDASQTADGSSSDTPSDTNPDGTPKGTDKELREERKALSWNEMMARHENQEIKDANQEDNDGIKKFRKDIAEGKFVDLPPAWKMHGVTQQVNVSQIQDVARDLSSGMASVGDLSNVETAKAQLGAAAAKFGFDADGYMARLDGLEKRVEDRLEAKVALEKHGVTPTTDRIRRVHEHGTSNNAVREEAEDQRESA